MYLIGLTGNIATGKSAVGQMLAEWGAEHIDADRLAHEVMAPGGAAYEPVIAAFGRDILHADGTIDRRALGAIVFAEPTALAKLESLVHPAVLAETERQIAASDKQVIVIEAIKLLESGQGAMCDAIWVTTCDEQQQLQRLMTLRGLSYAAARQRILAQPPQSEKLAQADVVITTNGTLAETRAQVWAAWQSIAATDGEQACI